MWGIATSIVGIAGYRQSALFSLSSIAVVTVNNKFLDSNLPRYTLSHFLTLKEQT